VQHAHHKGIVHRDLKPANILVTMVDGRPVPKVIDFGVAKATAGKLTEETMSTGFGAIVGTLEYMSPEQAGFANADVDTRADIYSLGVILYELLTGLRPIDASRLKHAALTEMVCIIQEEEPSKPSTRLSTSESLPSLAAVRHIEPKKLMALLRGDLDWVVMKCLEKQRDRRYETANGLARDIQRYLDGEAVEACPPSVGYRLGKFLRRNKGPVMAASLLLLVLVTGIVGTTWGMISANRARRAEAAQRTRAEDRESQAIDAVKRFRDTVADETEVKNNPSLNDLRTRLLQEPLAFFRTLRDSLLTDHDTRPESLARLAQASFELGELTDQIGDKQDALTAFRASLEIYQGLADDNPAVTEFRSELARCHHKLGQILQETGKLLEAEAQYGKAMVIWQELADAVPSVAEIQSDLAGTQNSVAMLLSQTGKSIEGCYQTKGVTRCYDVTRRCYQTPNF
jgi:serine/threonine protein kinase